MFPVFPKQYIWAEGIGLQHLRAWHELVDSDRPCQDAIRVSSLMTVYLLHPFTVCRKTIWKHIGFHGPMPLVCRRMSRNGILGCSAESESKWLRNQRCFWSFVVVLLCFWISGYYKKADGYAMAMPENSGTKKFYEIGSFWVLHSSFMLVGRGPHPLHAPTLQASGLDEGATSTKTSQIDATNWGNCIFFPGLSLYRNIAWPVSDPSWASPFVPLPLVSSYWLHLGVLCCHEPFGCITMTLPGYLWQLWKAGVSGKGPGWMIRLEISQGAAATNSTNEPLKPIITDGIVSNKHPRGPCLLRNCSFAR